MPLVKAIIDSLDHNPKGWIFDEHFPRACGFVKLYTKNWWSISVVYPYPFRFGLRSRRKIWKAIQRCKEKQLYDRQKT